MKAVFKAYSDRPVSVRITAQAFEDPKHFDSDPRIYALFDYLALNYYEDYCPVENSTRVVLDAQSNGCPVVITEFGSYAADDAVQASDYEGILELFRSLGVTDCIAWMWRADYDYPNPEPPGQGFNLAKNVDGTPRAAFSLLTNPPSLTPSPSPTTTAPTATPTSKPTPAPTDSTIPTPTAEIPEITLLALIIAFAVVSSAVILFRKNRSARSIN